MKNFEIEPIKAKIENEIVNAILVHEINDVFHNGDCILCDYAIDDFENDDDIEYALINDHTESCFVYDDAEEIYIIG